MQQPKPITRKYSYLIDNLKNGIYQIPKFQRDFVWGRAEVAKLIDSLLKEFPVGSFILWKTNERLKAIKSIGGKILNYSEDKDFIYYILDGQQRLTSLYLALEGLEIGKDCYKEIFIDLDKELDDNDEICTITRSENYISFYDLMNAKIADICKRYKEDSIIEKIDTLRQHIQNYEFSTIEIENQPLEKIADIFTRINVSGKELNLFEIMNAKVYSEPIIENKKIISDGFDLEEKFKELIEELKGCGYETIAENKTIILQLISLALSKNSKREEILSIPKDKFIREWDSVIECLKLAIDKIRDYFRIEVSKILPYYALIVPIAYFYIINKKGQPTNLQIRQLEKYFFRSAISWRFSSSVETKLNSDIKIIEKIENNMEIDFDKELPLENQTKEYFVKILKEDFSASNAFDKAVLCILAYFEPKKFSDNSKVRLDNSYLSIATSKNYHHFFPKAYLKKVKNDEYANALANITFVDDYLNKVIIKDKNPSKYMSDFKKQNKDLKEALKTHLIDLDDFGIMDDDFDKFINKRASKIADEIIKRI